MKAQIRILSGAHTGRIQVFSQTEIGVGRHSSSDLRFDPQRDLAVSARHGVIVRQADHWAVRDLESRNGIFVNGHRVKGDTPLQDTDHIRFGADGPTVEFRLVPDHLPDGVQAALHRPSAPAISTPATGTEPKRDSTTQRIRVEVGRQTRRLRLIVAGLLGLVVIGSVVISLSGREARRREAEIAALQDRSDSLRNAAGEALQALQGRVEELATALRTSQSDVAGLQQRLRRAQEVGNAVEVDALRRQLAEVTEAFQYQQAAAQVDYRQIIDANQRATALLYVEFGPGDVVTGTAFAVHPDGTLLTNRHLVAGPDGRKRPNRLGVQFADSDQFWPARVVAIAEDVDLAVVSVDIRGTVPTVKRLNSRPDTVRQGDPVALIGFPLGTELPMSTQGNRTVARTSFIPGSVSKVVEDRMQILGYGAPGASGSPVFDGNGEVIAILYGGEPGTEGRLLFAVPANYATTLLQALR